LRVLVISDEVWNDELNPNGNLSNWFSGSTLDVANVYCSPGLPRNNCCKFYFQVTDMMMLTSIFGNHRACVVLNYYDFPNAQEDYDNAGSEELAENSYWYRIARKVTSEPIRALRDIIWAIGRYNIKLLKEWIEEFSPDIIFSERMGSSKICRLERIVMRLANVPIVAFTGDDEYSFHQPSLSPFFWLRRIAVRWELGRNIPMYSLYYTLSEDQAGFYSKKFGVRTKVLRKGGTFLESRVHTEIHSPIRLVYIGKLYCNRWKTLVQMRKIIEKINEAGVRITLDIYTSDRLSKHRYLQLHDGKNSFLRGKAQPDQIYRLYSESDIVLHVEAFDLKYRQVTKLSFSTKIIDCLSSGCAVLIASWHEHAGYKYLSSQHAALLADSPKELRFLLNRLVSQPGLIIKYATKAYECGLKNHSREIVQATIIKDFRDVLAANGN